MIKWSTDKAKWPNFLQIVYIAIAIEIYMKYMVEGYMVEGY